MAQGDVRHYWVIYMYAFVQPANQNTAKLFVQQFGTVIWLAVISAGCIEGRVALQMSLTLEFLLEMMLMMVVMQRLRQSLGMMLFAVEENCPTIELRLFSEMQLMPIS